MTVNVPFDPSIFKEAFIPLEAAFIFSFLGDNSNDELKVLGVDLFLFFFLLLLPLGGVFNGIN